MTKPVKRAVRRQRRATDNDGGWGFGQQAPAPKPPTGVSVSLREIKDQLDRIEALLERMPVGSAGRGRDYLTRS